MFSGLARSQFIVGLRLFLSMQQYSGVVTVCNQSQLCLLHSRRNPVPETAIACLARMCLLCTHLRKLLRSLNWDLSELWALPLLSNRGDIAMSMVMTVCGKLKDIKLHWRLEKLHKTKWMIWECNPGSATEVDTQTMLNQVWWLMPLLLALMRLRQENRHGLEASLA